MAFWDDVAEFVGGIAPTIGSALGGPLGGLAGAALASALGVDDPTDKKKLQKALQNATPEQFIELKKADIAFQTKLRELDIDIEKIHASDRDSARRRQEAVKDRMPSILACMITAGFFGVLFYMLVSGLPDKGGEALLVMLGSLGTAWTACVSYYFGSSMGSEAKTKLMAETMRGQIQ